MATQNEQIRINCMYIFIETFKLNKKNVYIT